MRGIVTDMNAVTEWGIEAIPEDGRLSISALSSRLSERDNNNVIEEVPTNERVVPPLNVTILGFFYPSHFQSRNRKVVRVFFSGAVPRPFPIALRSVGRLP